MNSRLSFFWLAFLPAAVLCQLRVTPPESFFGHPLGADYHLINYEQYVAYLKKLDAESAGCNWSTSARPQRVGISSWRS